MKYVVLKFCSLDQHEKPRRELELSRHIAAVKPGHPALQYIRLVQDSFEILGYMRPHLCLVYDPMREPLWLLQRRFSDGVYSLPLLLYTVKFLLTGLAYLYDKCNIIHTGQIGRAHV